MPAKTPAATCTHTCSSCSDGVTAATIARRAGDGGVLGATGDDEAGCVVAVEGSAGDESLVRRTALVAQELEMFGFLHAFGDRVDAEAAAGQRPGAPVCLGNNGTNDPSILSLANENRSGSTGCRSPCRSPRSPAGSPCVSSFSDCNSWSDVSNSSMTARRSSRVSTRCCTSVATSDSLSGLGGSPTSVCTRRRGNTRRAPCPDSALQQVPTPPK